MPRTVIFGPIEGVLGYFLMPGEYFLINPFYPYRSQANELIEKSY